MVCGVWCVGSGQHDIARGVDGDRGVCPRRKERWEGRNAEKGKGGGRHTVTVNKYLTEGESGLCRAPKERTYVDVIVVPLSPNERKKHP